MLGALYGEVKRLSATDKALKALIYFCHCYVASPGVFFLRGNDKEEATGSVSFFAA